MARDDKRAYPPLGALWWPTATAGRGAPEWEFWRAVGWSDWGWGWGCREGWGAEQVVAVFQFGEHELGYVGPAG